jgi:hypothetical protein
VHRRQPEADNTQLPVRNRLLAAAHKQEAAVAIAAEAEVMKQHAAAEAAYSLRLKLRLQPRRWLPPDQHFHA